MAMTKCTECSAEISDKAESCPKCGAKIEKKSGHGWVILLSVFAFLFVIFKINSCSTEQAKIPETPEQIAAKIREDARLTKTVIVLRTIKTNLRNPDSVRWEGIWANDDASVICVQYRAQNAFGGMAREHISVIKGNPSQDPAAWNNSCTKPLTNMSHAEFAM